MIVPFLASVAFGFVKGWSEREAPEGFSLEQDFIGPVREEIIYRGAPLWAFPGLPYGTTAVTFAVDHVLSDSKKREMDASDVVSRFGDVLFGGLAYEAAFRQSGIFGAVAAHMAHNMAISWGSKARRRFA